MIFEKMGQAGRCKIAPIIAHIKRYEPDRSVIVPEKDGKIAKITLRKCFVFSAFRNQSDSIKPNQTVGPV